MGIRVGDKVRLAAGLEPGKIYGGMQFTQDKCFNGEHAVASIKNGVVRINGSDKHYTLEMLEPARTKKTNTITVNYSTKVFVWNGTMIGRNRYYGFFKGQAFVTDGIKLSNDAMMVSFRKNGIWSEDKFVSGSSTLVKTIHRMAMDKHRAENKALNEEGRLSVYNSISQVKNPSGVKVLPMNY